MRTINVVQARKYFSDLMAQVAYRGDRLVVERRGKPMMAWINMEDLRRLEELDQTSGSRRERREAALAQAAAARQTIRAERGGRPLPDSADVLDGLREPG